MGFSCYIRDKNGKDLLDKYGIHYKLNGLAPDCASSTMDVPHQLTDIRYNFVNVPYKDEFPKAAKDAVLKIKEMLKENLESLKKAHPECPHCRCEVEIEDWDWSIEDIEKFLELPIEEVHSAGGGW